MPTNSDRFESSVDSDATLESDNEKPNSPESKFVAPTPAPTAKALGKRPMLINVDDFSSDEDIIKPPVMIPCPCSMERLGLMAVCRQREPQLTPRHHTLSQSHHTSHPSLWPVRPNQLQLHPHRESNKKRSRFKFKKVDHSPRLQQQQQRNPSTPMPQNGNGIWRQNL